MKGVFFRNTVMIRKESSFSEEQPTGTERARKNRGRHFTVRLEMREPDHNFAVLTPLSTAALKESIPARER